MKKREYQIGVIIEQQLKDGVTEQRIMQDAKMKGGIEDVVEDYLEKRRAK